MRLLFASTRGAGHFLPLVPFIDACAAAGHDVLVAGPPSLAATVGSTGYAFWEVAEPPADELGPVWARVGALPQHEQNVVVVGEIFGGLNATAALPRLLEAGERWRPDLIVREPAEFASAVAADVLGLPQARTAIGLAWMEQFSLEVAARRVDALRRASGLAPDPALKGILDSPCLTRFPASFEDPTAFEQPNTWRFRDPAWDRPASPLPDWWDGATDPLVYVTFGSVAGGYEQARRVYTGACAALDDLPVRVLLTVGSELDPATLGPLPANVHVEQWVDQSSALAGASAVICHGGSGSTLGALAAGLPQVVVPLFADQPHNASRVEAIGVGLRVEPPSAPAMRAALVRVLDEASFGAAARSVAAEMRTHAPMADAVRLFENLVVTGRADRVELGIYTFAERTPDPTTGLTVSAAQRLRDLIEEIELADQVGLDVFGVGEHHRPDFAVSSPAVVLAAGAERTTRIRLTSAVSVISSDDPVRVFQDFATLDLLSGGRAEIMAGRGSFIESFPLFGYDLDDYDDLFAEGLDLLLALRESERVTWSGRHRAPLHDLGVYPRPLQEPLPIWIAVGGTPASAVRAGALGLPMALAIIGGMPERFAGFADLHRRAAEEACHDASAIPLSINSHGFIADTSQEAADASYPAFAATMNAIGRERGWPPLGRADFEAGRQLRGANFVGSPQEVTEKILFQHEIFQHDRFLLQVTVGTLPHPQVMRAIELFGTEVAPAVRKALG